MYEKSNIELVSKLKTRIVELETRNETLETQHAHLATDSRRIKLMLRRSVEEFQLIFENSLDAILWVDPDTRRIINANGAAEKLWGLPREKMLGTCYKDFHPSEAHEEVGHIFEKAVETASTTFETRIITHDGRRIPVEVITTRAELDRRMIIQGVFHDITERKRSESEQDAAIKLLSLLNSHIGYRDLMTEIVSLLRLWSDCEAVALRLNEDGDFPYFEAQGFPEEFVRLDSSLRATGGKRATAISTIPAVPCLSAYAETS